MIKNDKIFSGTGYKYKDERDETYVEFHVNDHPMFTGMGSVHPFGGNLSVCKPQSEKPMIFLGQDECIYCQYTFRNKCWVGPNGETPLMPKSEGQGLMVSGFVSREYGFGWTLSKKQLQTVNKFCKKKHHYIDEKSALSKYGKTAKDKLDTTPL